MNFLKNFDEQVVCRLLLTNLSLLIYRKPLPNSFINATIKTRELLQFRLLVISVLYEFKTLLMRRMVLFINSYCFFVGILLTKDLLLICGRSFHVFYQKSMLSPVYQHHDKKARIAAISTAWSICFVMRLRYCWYVKT